MNSHTQDFLDWLQAQLRPEGEAVGDLAERLGYDRAHVSRILNGKTPVSRKFAEKCEAKLEVSAGEILRRQALRAETAAKFKNDRPVVPVLEIKASQLEAWAKGLTARSRLAVLLRRLVHETVPDASKVDFPGNDQSQTSGWDGEVECRRGSAFVPSGASGWEFGVGEPKEKANKDYAQRLKTQSSEDRAITTFVFVSPRVWPGKMDWAEQKKKESEFADVRVIDGDTLEQWLETAPSTQVWMSEELGLPLDGLQSLQDVWRSWQVDRADLLTPSLFTESVLALRPELTAWLKAPSDVLRIAADSLLEGAALIAALSADDRLQCDLVTGLQPDEEKEGADGKDVAQLNDEQLVAQQQIRTTLDRITVFSKPAAVKRYMNERTTLLPIVLADDVEAALAETAPDRPYIRIHTRGMPVAESQAVIDPLSFSGFRSHLGKNGLDDRAIEKLDETSGRSLSILRRRVSHREAVSRPEWAADQDGTLLLALAFVSRLNADNANDQAVLELLVDQPFADIEKRVLALTDLDDSPVWVIGNQLGVKSQIDIIYTFGASLTTDEVNRLFDVAGHVLTERDPSLDLPEEDRPYAAVYGKTRDFSGGLRRGIAKGALALTCSADGLCADHVANTVARRARKLARSLITPWDDDTLRSVNDILPLIAELSPDVFLDTLRSDLSGERNTLGLLSPIDSALFGARNYRTGLLWALETLAWSQDHLPTVVSILADLSTVPIDDNWVNKPRNTLGSLFRSWLPQTSADTEERKSIFRRLWETHPKQAWSIASSEISDSLGWASRNSTPEYRDYADGVKPVTNQDIWEFRRFCFLLCLNKPDHTYETLGDLLGIVEHMAEEDEATFWASAIAWAETASDPDRVALRDRLRKRTRSRFAARRKRDKGEDRFDEAAADRLYDALRPVDPVTNILWLFEDHWIDIADQEDLDADWRTRDDKIVSVRMTALLELIENEGEDRLYEILRRCGSPHTVGWIFANSAPSLDRAVEVLVNAEQSVQPRLNAERFVGGFMLRTSLDLATLLECLKAEGKQDLVEWAVVQAPFERKTWDIVEVDENLKDIYWERTRPFWMETAEDSERAARAFFAQQRPAAALDVLARQFSSADATLIADILEALASADGEEQVQAAAAHHVEDAFEALNESDLVPEDRLLSLEFRYLRRLQNTRYGIPTIEAAVAKDPTVIIQALSFVYKRDDEQDDPPGFGLAADPNPDFASAMWRFLNDWSYLPGSAAGSGHDKSAMLAQWVVKALELGREVGRGGIVASTVGQFAGRSAPQDGDLWPAEWVVDALEPYMCERMSSGFFTGKLNSRGVHGFTSGKEERAMAQGFGYAAEYYRISHPNVAKALRSLEEHYLEDGRRNWLRGELKKRADY